MKKIYLLFLAISIMRPARGDYILTDIVNGCSVSHLHSFDNVSNMIPMFTLNEYTCDVGEFLPAYTLGCRSCPASYTCNGGTFDFNNTVSQGIESTAYIAQSTSNTCSTNFLRSINNRTDMFPVFTPNQHTCTAGYYMPANYDGCQLCPINSYCGGGTYAFNETLSQGAVSCASGLFAPAGMWESAQCGRILHIGDQIVYLRSVKKTLPSVNVDIDNDGVADFFGNMTTLDVPMTNGTQRKLKLSYGGQTYSVYDDSVNLGEYQD